MTLRAPRLLFGLDPLIAEAKRRMRRRRFLVGAMVIVLAAAVLIGVLALRTSPRPEGIPTYPRTGIVPTGVREIDVQSALPGETPVASVRVTDPAVVGRIARLIDRLKIAKPVENASCLAIEGPTVTLGLLDGNGHLRAGASVVTNDGFGLSRCNPLLFARGGSVLAGRGLHGPQAALSGHTLRQGLFVRQLQGLVGTPLCQRSTGTPAQSC